MQPSDESLYKPKWGKTIIGTTLATGLVYVTAEYSGVQIFKQYAIFIAPSVGVLGDKSTHYLSRKVPLIFSWLWSIAINQFKRMIANRDVEKINTFLKNKYIFPDHRQNLTIKLQNAQNFLANDNISGLLNIQIKSNNMNMGKEEPKKTPPKKRVPKAIPKSRARKKK